jgi:hypothetical protein
MNVENINFYDKHRRDLLNRINELVIKKNNSLIEEKEIFNRLQTSDGNAKKAYKDDLTRIRTDLKLTSNNIKLFTNDVKYIKYIVNLLFYLYLNVISC